MVVLGASGDGKTSLLKSIAGLLAVDSGKIVFKGVKVKDPSGKLIPGHDEIKLVDQDFGLDLFHTVEENIRLKLLAYTEDFRSERVEELLDLIELKDFRGQKPKELSGGQQQRLAIARALADDPELILLDEPFNQLDFQMKSMIGGHIKDYLKDHNMSAILVTHNGQEAMEWADRIVYLHEGKIERIDTPENFYHHPRNIKEARFFGEVNLVATNGEEIYFRPGIFSTQPSDFCNLELKVKYLSRKNMGWYDEYRFESFGQEIKVLSTENIESAGVLFVRKLSF